MVCPYAPGFRGDVVRHPFEELELTALAVEHELVERGQHLGGLPIRPGFRGDVVRHPFEELELTALAVEHELVERGQHLGYGGGQLMR